MSSRVMIGGTGSGCGKTTVTCALLSALSAMGKDVVAFKCGPDYIDPMFHKKAAGVESGNLDVYLMGEEGVKLSLARSSAKKDIAVLEGVMGLYDGVYEGSYASSNHVSLLTGTPVILVVNPKGTALSVCAVIKGFLELEENNIQGVILNNVSQALFGFYKGIIEGRLKVSVLGFMPPIPECEIPSRHLGLVTADEVARIKEKLETLGKAALAHIDIKALLAVADGCAPVISQGSLPSACVSCPPVKIYAAKDEAFSFWYEDNHELLRALGAEIASFSPIHDRKLPKDADGILLWGGYPELYAKELQENTELKAGLRAAIENGMPVYAECGGFMYLQRSLTDLRGETYQMLGLLCGSAQMTERLQNFGYCRLTAQRDNILCKAGEGINAHFFRYSKSDAEGDCFIARKESGKEFSCVVCEGNVFAGYQHLHFWGNASFAEGFVKACAKYAQGRSKGGIYNKPHRD